MDSGHRQGAQPRPDLIPRLPLSRQQIRVHVLADITDRAHIGEVRAQRTGHSPAIPATATGSYRFLCVVGARAHRPRQAARTARRGSWDGPRWPRTPRTYSITNGEADEAVVAQFVDCAATATGRTAPAPPQPRLRTRSAAPRFPAARRRELRLRPPPPVPSAVAASRATVAIPVVGAASTAAMPAPAHSIGRRNNSCGPTAATADRTARHTTAGPGTSSAPQRPLRRRAPAATGRRAAAPTGPAARSPAATGQVRGCRASASARSVVHTPVACAAAVNPCARRSHPSSRAMRPATTTPPAVASTAGTRKAIIEPGAMASVNAASAVHAAADRPIPSRGDSGRWPACTPRRTSSHHRMRLQCNAIRQRWPRSGEPHLWRTVRCADWQRCRFARRHVRPRYCRGHGTRYRRAGAGGARSIVEAIGQAEPPPIGDVETRRVNGHRMFDYVATTWEPVPGVEVDKHTLTTADGATLDLDWYPHACGSAGQCGAVSARRRHDLRP